MTQNEFHCEHTCLNSCASLTRALQLETTIVRLAEETLQQCDDADIKAFFVRLAENGSETTLRILQKLNEIQARSQIVGGISRSFDP